MKRTVKAFGIVAVIAILFPAFIYAGGKPFEGIITYKISYPDSKISESQLAMFPKVMTISIKGNKSRIDKSSGMGNQTIITNYSEKNRVVLIDIMGQKLAIKETTAEIQKENEKDPIGKIEITSETKTIVGYLCKKAIVTTEQDGEKTVYEAWFTSELGSKDINFDRSIFKDIDGLLMEFSTKEDGNLQKLNVTGIEKKSISDKDFEIPPDFKLTTMEELKSKFGGMEK